MGESKENPNPSQMRKNRIDYAWYKKNFYEKPCCASGENSLGKYEMVKTHRRKYSNGYEKDIYYCDRMRLYFTDMNNCLQNLSPPLASGPPPPLYLYKQII